MNDFVQQYFEHVQQQLAELVEAEADNIHAAAKAFADAIEADKDVLTFGSGHSALVAKEPMWRAGGLAPLLNIQDHTGGDAERVEGVAAVIFKHYQLRAGSVLVIISNSGVNPVPVEAAQIAKAAGVAVVAITGLAHSRHVASRHSSGQKLYELADIVIDTHTPSGDAGLSLPESGFHVGATSTLAGVFIMQAVTAQASALLEARGMTAPVLVSANLPEGDAHNQTLSDKYLPRLVRYAIETTGL